MPTKVKSYALERSPLHGLQSRSKLAGLLFVSKKELRRLSGDEHLYKHFNAKKKDGSLRPVGKRCAAHTLTAATGILA